MEPSPAIPQQIFQTEVLEIPVEPKEKPIDFDVDSIQFLKFKFVHDEHRKSRERELVWRSVRINSVSQIVKEQNNKEDKL